MTKHSHNRKSHHHTFHIAILTVAICTVTLFMQSCQESKIERFVRETAEYTKKNCPQRIGTNDLIILDSLVFHDDGTLDYINYYSVNADSVEVAYLISQKDELRQTLLSGIISSVELKNVKAEGLNIVHKYIKADTKEPIFDFRFTPEDYNPNND